MPFASICHGYQASSVETQSLAELVLKHPLVEDAVSALSAVARIASLDTQTGHNPVPLAALVVALEGELDKVADGKRGLPGPELENDIAR